MHSRTTLELSAIELIELQLTDTGDLFIVAEHEARAIQTRDATFFLVNTHA